MACTWGHCLRYSACVLISQYKVSCTRLSVGFERCLNLTWTSLTIRTFLTQKQQRIHPVTSKYLYTANTAHSDSQLSNDLPRTMADPIHRLLFTTPSVHIYAIPPLTSTRGFNAGPWTAPPKPTAQQIFTARMRVLETSIPSSSSDRDLLSVTINLEDPATGELFAASPYVSEAVVQSALDSSRFFAVRVVGEGGMKATLGIGFEDRSEAFDFGIALSEARKVLGWEKAKGTEKNDVFKDFSLKEGEKIHIQVGGKGRKESDSSAATVEREDGQALFSIAPPPSGAAFPSIAPPPSSNSMEGKTAQELGFDDGEFGEFQ